MYHFNFLFKKRKKNLGRAKTLTDNPPPPQVGFSSVESTFYLAVFTFEASWASANVLLHGISHVARSVVQAGLSGAKILLKEKHFQ